MNWALRTLHKGSFEIMHTVSLIYLRTSLAGFHLICLFFLLISFILSCMVIYLLAFIVGFLLKQNHFMYSYSHYSSSIIRILTLHLSHFNLVVVETTLTYHRFGKCSIDQSHPVVSSVG